MNNIEFTSIRPSSHLLCSEIVVTEDEDINFVLYRCILDQDDVSSFSRASEIEKEIKSLNLPAFKTGVGIEINDIVAGEFRNIKFFPVKREH